MITKPLSTVPAGWYADPLGMPQLRWWSGTSWSVNVSAARPELVVSNSHRVAVAS